VCSVQVLRTSPIFTYVRCNAMMQKIDILECKAEGHQHKMQQKNKQAW
jgi:hypothetical protein